MRAIFGLAVTLLGVLAVSGLGGTSPHSGPPSPPHSGGASQVRWIDGVRVELGPCSIGQVLVAGDAWAVHRDDQFGSRGPLPRAWVGAGRVRAIGDEVTYLDRGGKELRLVRPDSPDAALPERC